MRHKRFEMYRDYLEHEDGLINSRLTWNLTVQGFLFAAFGLLLQKQADIEQTTRLALVNAHLSAELGDVAAALPKLPHYALLDQAISHWLPAMGFLISLAAFLGVRAAHESLVRLGKLWVLSEFSYATRWPGKRKSSIAELTAELGTDSPINVTEESFRKISDYLHKNPNRPVLPPLAGGGVGPSLMRHGFFISMATPILICCAWGFIFFRHVGSGTLQP